MLNFGYDVGSRAKHIKASPRPNCYEEKRDSGSSASFPPPRVNGNEDKCDSGSIASSPPTDESSARILDKVRILLWDPLYVFVITIGNKTSVDAVEGEVEC